jgi:hypothetical protein
LKERVGQMSSDRNKRKNKRNKETGKKEGNLEHLKFKPKGKLNLFKTQKSWKVSIL